MVHWITPVLLHVLIAYGLTAWLIKKAAGMHSRTQRLFLQYVFAALFAAVFAFARGELVINRDVLLLGLVGLFNGFGAYCQWRARDISLSKDSLFTFWDDIIAMSLSFFILGESRFISSGVAAGMTISLIAVILMVAHSYLKQQAGKGGNGRTSGAFLGFVGAYSIVWGVAVFAMRFLAVSDMPIGTFLFGWYGGSLISATAIMLVYKEKGGGEKKNNLALRERGTMLLWGAGLALGIVVSLATAYWSYQLAPQVVVQPLYLVAEMIVPTLVGLYLFGEHRHLDGNERLFFLMGIAGGIVVAVSFGG